MFGGMRNTTRRLPDLPNGLHHVLVASGGRPSVDDGVGDDILECLDVTYDLTGTFVHFGSTLGLKRTFVCRWPGPASRKRHDTIRFSARTTESRIGHHTQRPRSPSSLDLRATLRRYRCRGQANPRRTNPRRTNLWVVVRHRSPPGPILGVGFDPSTVPSNLGDHLIPHDIHDLRLPPNVFHMHRPVPRPVKNSQDEFAEPPKSKAHLSHYPIVTRQAESLSLCPEEGHFDNLPGVSKIISSRRGVPDFLQESGAFTKFGILSLIA